MDETDRDTRIAQLRSACGCKEGAIAFVLCAALYAMFPAYFPQGGTISLRVLIGAGIGLGAAMTAKLAALMIAQVRLRHLLRNQGPTRLISHRVEPR